MEGEVYLKWPDKRIELVAYLQEVIGSACDGSAMNVDDLVHFIFDDTDLSSGIESEIGRYIFPNEVSPLKDFVTSLEALVDQLGDVSSDRYVNSDKWQEIALKARYALEALVRNSGDTTLD